MGADFSNVRIHDDSNAAQMSKDLNAQAFTHGNDIYFNSGKYDTSSSAGQHLLAHELTHTVQQGKSFAGSSNDSIDKSDDSPSIQRIPDDSTTDQTPASKIPGPPYKKDGYELELKNGLMILTVPKVSLPAFKDRNKSKFVFPAAFMAGRIDSNQVSNWNADVKSDVEKSTQTFLEGKNKELKNGIYYFKSGKSNFEVFGKAQQLANEFRIPKWDRFGQSTPHSVDHIVELQLGGGDGPENYELLDTLANSTIGSVLQKEIYKRIQDGRKFFNDNNVPGVPSFKELTRKDSPVALVYFHDVEHWNLKPEKGNPDAYWSIGEVKSGFPLQQLRPMTLEEIHKLNGNDKNFHLFVKPNEGTPHTIELPAKKITNWLPGIDLLSVNVSNLSAPDDAVMGTVSIALQPDLAKKLNSNSEITLNFTKIPGLVNAGALVFTGVADGLAKVFSFKGLSPIEMTSFDITDKGLMITGVIKADNPLIQGASIDFSVVGKDLTFRKTFSLGDVKSFPPPFKITDISLSIFASTEYGFGVEGNIDFEINKFGRGSIKGEGATGKGFAIGGDFFFDKKTFDGAVHVKYAKGLNEETGKWTFKGEVSVGKNKIKGVDKATLKVSSEEGEIKASGIAELSVPGIKEVKINAVVSPNGDFSIEGDVEFKKLPGIKSGSAKITVTSKGGEGLKLGLSGEAEPDLPNVPSLNGIKLAISYQDGIFELKAHVPFKKGKFDGAIDVGVTNRTVDDTGKPQGEAPEKGDVVAFGYGQLGVDIYNGIHGSVSIRLTPDHEVLIGGKIEAKELKPFGEGYNYDKEIIPFPTIEFPLAGIPGLSVSAFIGGGVHFKFNWQPLILKDLSLDFKETNIKDLATVSLEIMGSVGSSAHAEVYLKIEAGLKARAAIAVLKGSLAGEAGLGLDAEAGGKVDATWDMEKGLKFKEIRAFLNVEPKAIFRLTGKVSVDLDLWIASVNIYEHEWVLAEKQLDLSGITLKLDFPIKFKETGEVELPEYDKMNVVQPDFKGDAGNKILDDAINGDAKKEEAAKKEKLKVQIHDDMRSADNKDVSPSEYEKKMREKYEDTPELQAFVSTTIHDEAKKIEYEDFEQLKDKLRKDPAPAEAKYVQVNVFEMFHGYVQENDYEALKSELKKIDEDKKLAAANAANNTTPPDPNKPAGDTPAPPPPPPPPPVSSPGNNSTPVQTKLINDNASSDTIQRKEDKHDLNSKELAGDPILEQCFDGPRAVVNPEVGLHVKRIQEALIKLGIELPKFGVDGKYGDETENAVKEFQEKAGMSESERDGKVGKKTIALLDMSLRNNSISSDPDKAADDLVLHNPQQIKDDEDCKGKPDDETCPVPNKDVNEAADAAIALIDRVINEQLPPNKTTKADFTSIFEVLFRTNDTRDVKATAEEVKKNYIEIRKFLELIKKDPSHVRCGTACDGGCRSGSPAYHGKSGDLHILTFCPDFKSDPDRIFIVLHESHHAAIKGSRDIAYQHTRLIDKLDHKQALLNAASFHMYAKLVNDPSSDQIGPAVKDSDSIADPDKKKKAELALAQIEQWMNLVTFDMSVVSADMDKAKNNGKYGADANLKKINIYVNWLNITAPPTKPTESDIAQAKAMEERTRLMEDAFDQVFDISESTDGSSWERGPGTDISLNKNLLALDIRHMVIALLQELVHATPDVSAEREPLYVGVINDLRNNRKLAP